MKAILLLVALFIFAGCSDGPTVALNHGHPPVPVDTVKVCPPCADTAKVPDCNENGNCEKDD